VQTLKQAREKFGVKVETSKSAHDGTLTLIISGKRDAVAAAKAELCKSLQKIAEIFVTIPVAHHRAIIGKGGSVIKAIQVGADSLNHADASLVCLLRVGSALPLVFVHLLCCVVWCACACVLRRG
jgi:hypothetical protein